MLIDSTVLLYNYELLGHIIVEEFIYRSLTLQFKMAKGTVHTDRPRLVSRGVHRGAVV